MFPIQTAVDSLLKQLPACRMEFKGSEFPLPVHTAYYSGTFPETESYKLKLQSVKGDDAKPYVDMVVLGAEAIESNMADKESYFITDRKLQNYVFMGSKWRAGWALVLGGEGSENLIESLKKREFMIFTDIPGIADTWYIGNRETSPVYFLQMMVRYGLVWGRIKAGDDHQLGHYLEKDMPGVIIIRKDLSPLKYLVTLGLMKLGAPALVPSTFPFPYGNRVVSDTDDEILERINGFENLRTKMYAGETIALPDYANIAFANQEFEVAGRLGGNSKSFISMRPAENRKRQYDSETVNGTDIGIVLDVYEKNFTVDISAEMERSVYRALNFVDGWKAKEETEGFVIEWAAASPFEIDKAKEAIIAGLRLQFPGMKDFNVTIIQNSNELEKLSIEVKEFKENRKKLIDGMTEENTTLFGVCTECRPFSLVHTCIITPDRTPMCAARTYFSVKAAYYFGSDQKPFKRRDEQELPLRFMFERGKILDLQKGEYEGANEIYKKMTKGTLNKVRLHSLDKVPHTSCGCFQNLAFRIQGHGGIGIMKRGSTAVTPDGRTWEMLANYAGGKQSDGIMGVSNQYIGSPNFLRGDGGLKSVVWVDSDLYGRIKSKFPEKQKIFTEKEAKSVADLKLL